MSVGVIEIWKFSKEFHRVRCGKSEGYTQDKKKKSGD